MKKKINYSFKAGYRLQDNMAEEEISSLNTMYSNGYCSVIYCEHCHKMNKFVDFLTLEKGEINKELEDVIEKIIVNCWKYDNFYNVIEDYVFYKNFLDGASVEKKEILKTLEYKKESKNYPLLTCPECGGVIKNKNVKELCKSNNWQRENSFLYQYDIIKENDKIIYSIYLFTVFPNTKYGKLKYEKINLRFVFNTTTHNVYAFQPYNCDTHKPLYKDSRRIVNITYFRNSLNFITDIECKYLSDKTIINYIAKYLCNYYGKNYDDVFDKNDISFKDVVIFFRYYTYDNKTRNMISLFNRDIYTEKNINQKRKLILQDIYKMQFDRDYFYDVVKTKKCPLKKKFVKLCASNPFNIYLYKELKKLGFNDYNIILDILGSINDELDCLKNKYGYNFNSEVNSAFSIFINAFLEKDKYITFSINRLIQIKGEIWCRNNIFNLLFNKDVKYYRFGESTLLNDTCKMFYEYVDNNFDIIPFIDKLDVMHNNLCSKYHLIKNRNKKIPYKKEMLNINYDTGEYHFRLAPDTNSLINCGQCMGICVGAYGNSAYSGKCAIVFMFKNDKFVGCIELSSNLKYLVQAKAKYNNLIQKDDAYALKEWVELNDINTCDCCDYNHIKKGEIIYDDDKIYVRNYNYASVKIENLNKINVNNVYDYDYEITK